MTVPQAPPSPRPRLSLAVTGHRQQHAALAGNHAAVAAALAEVFDQIATAAAAGPADQAPIRLSGLLADGVDQLAAGMALARGWDLVAPLPFGPALNLAVAAQPISEDDARAVLAGGVPADADAAARVAAIRGLYDQAALFALGDRDADISAALLAMLAAPQDVAQAVAFTARASERVALAGRVMLAHADIVIGVWDGASEAFVGGTGHTIAAALDAGAAVVRIDPARPADWHVLRSPEALVSPPAAQDRAAVLAGLVQAALCGDMVEEEGFRAGPAALNDEPWPAASPVMFHGYRRVEAIFGGGWPLRSIRHQYESPAAFVRGTGAPILDQAARLPGGDQGFIRRIADDVLARFAFADAVAASLSDYYRGGMIANFLLSGLAVITGIAYQPLTTAANKWMFALVEFLFLVNILIITWAGKRWRWHGRWFEVRRVAEYCRHAPALLLLGVARPPGRWPKGSDTSWPETYARHALSALGLPRVTVTPAYLRTALTILDDTHVKLQRDYHHGKAQRLTRVHHRLDGLSSRAFQLAVVAVTIYLACATLGGMGQIDAHAMEKLAKIFTFLGVMLPMVGATAAGIRYFGDFERFAAISEVTAEKLGALHARITLLLSGPDSALEYGRVAELAHAADDIVVAEIENWQAVFGGKHITVPV